MQTLPEKLGNLKLVLATLCSRTPTADDIERVLVMDSSAMSNDPDFPELASRFKDLLLRYLRRSGHPQSFPAEMRVKVSSSDVLSILEEDDILRPVAFVRSACGSPFIPRDVEKICVRDAHQGP